MEGGAALGALPLVEAMTWSASRRAAMGDPGGAQAPLNTPGG